MDLSALDGITDPQALRALLADAQAIIAHKDALLSQRDQSIERKEALIGQLRREIARLRRLQLLDRKHEELARELDDAILHMRTNELDIGTWILKTEGDAAAIPANRSV